MTWQNRSSRTCAGPARHAVGLSLIVSVIILDAHQVGVGLRAEMRSDADDMLVGCIYHLLHLENKQDVYFIILGETSGCCWSNDQKCSTHNTEYIDKVHQTLRPALGMMGNTFQSQIVGLCLYSSSSSITSVKLPLGMSM